MHFLFSILDQKHKQTLAFNGGVAIGNFDGKILLASATSVYRLKPVSIQIQIEVSEDIFYSLIESLQGMEFVTWSISLKFPPWICSLVCLKLFFCKQLSLVVNKQGQRTMKITVVLSCGSERKKVPGIWPSPSLDTIFSESEFIKIKIF